MKFRIYQDGDGYWRWRLRAANNEIIASGEAYVRAACIRTSCVPVLIRWGRTGWCPGQPSGGAPRGSIPPGSTS